MKLIINTSKDEEIAKMLEMEFMKNDEEMGRRSQMEINREFENN